MNAARTSGVATRRVEHVWGTVISLEVRDPVAAQVLDDVFGWFRRVDDLFSTWRDDTEISRIGRGELVLARAGSEVREVLERCEQMRRETGGAFDVTVGAHALAASRAGLAPLDPSGFVKGWALERAAERLEAAGVTRFSINAGGDVLVRGGFDTDTAWRVGIQHPWESDRVAAVVGLFDGAVATSGRAERGDHVLDPRTGQPAHGLMSATVIGPDLARADALATAAIAHGGIDADWLAPLGIAAMAITDAHTVVTTPEFDAYRVR